MSNAEAGTEVPWKTFLAIAAVAIGCSFEAGVASQEPGGEDNTYECTCQCDPQVVSQTVAVEVGTDDAEEFVGAEIVNLASTDLEITFEDGISPQIVGVRFTGLGIPAGSTVLSAQIQFTTDEVTSAASNFQIHGQLADSAPTFSATDGDLSGRPLTTAVVPWSPPPWSVLNEAGPAQLTPNLAAILQELVDRPGWTSDSAVVFLFTGIGYRAAWAFERGAANAPRLVLQYQEPGLTALVRTCVTPDKNPNLDGGVAATEADLTADCTGRVQDTVTGLNGACGYPALCTCSVTPDSGTYSATCDEPCVEEPLAFGCTNYNPADGGTSTATNVAGDVPVCGPLSPVTAALFGQRSRCEVSGTATIEVEDEETKVTPATGVIELVGSPCPNQSCAVGMGYLLELGNITYDHLFGSATFRDMASVGESGPGAEAMLDATGSGAFAPSSLVAGGRGRRGSDFTRILATNDNPVSVGVLWSGSAPTCSLSGAVVGNTDPELSRCEPAGPSASALCTTDDDCVDDEACTDEVCNCLPIPESDMALSLDVEGPLVNQPPTANAGPDEVVECNAAGGAIFRLQSLSADPDGNLALVRWYLGDRSGPEVGVSPRPRLQQAVGTTSSYVLRVMDGLAQGDEDTVQVEVVDTTPPQLFCNALAAIHPGQRIQFTATAEDVCDPDATPEVTAIRCVKNGKPHPCGVHADGDTLIVDRPGGAKTVIQWDLRVEDLSGNVTTRTCEVRVDPAAEKVGFGG